MELTDTFPTAEQTAAKPQLSAPLPRDSKWQPSGSQFALEMTEADPSARWCLDTHAPVYTCCASISTCPSLHCPNQVFCCGLPASKDAHLYPLGIQVPSHNAAPSSPGSQQRHVNSLLLSLPHRPLCKFGCLNLLQSTQVGLTFI